MEIPQLVIYGSVGACGGVITALIGWAQAPENESFSKKKFAKMLILLTVGGAVAGVLSNDWKSALMASGLPALIQGLKPVWN